MFVFCVLFLALLTLLSFFTRCRLIASLLAAVVFVAALLLFSLGGRTTTLALLLAGLRLVGFRRACISSLAPGVLLISAVDILRRILLVAGFAARLLLLRFLARLTVLPRFVALSALWLPLPILFLPVLRLLWLILVLIEVLVDLVDGLARIAFRVDAFRLVALVAALLTALLVVTALLFLALFAFARIRVPFARLLVRRSAGFRLVARIALMALAPR